MDATLTLLTLVLVVPVSGALMAITPYLMPKRECFAVTVPEAAQQDGVLRGCKRKFALWCAALTVACTALMTFAVIPIMSAPADPSTYGSLIRALVGCTLAVTLVPFCFMLHFRKKVMALKRERGWFVPRQEAAVLVAEDDVPHAVSLAWNLLYIPVLLVIIAIGAVAYPSMPDMIPMHADFAGNVNDWWQRRRQEHPIQGFRVREGRRHGRGAAPRWDKGVLSLRGGACRGGVHFRHPARDRRARLRLRLQLHSVKDACHLGVALLPGRRREAPLPQRRRVVDRLQWGSRGCR